MTRATVTDAMGKRLDNAGHEAAFNRLRRVRKTYFAAGVSP